jgi:hypothetical protein
VPDGAESRESAIEELARGAPAHVRDEPDAACIAVASRIVEKALRVAHCVEVLSDEWNEGSPADALELVGGGGRWGAG